MAKVIAGLGTKLSATFLKVGGSLVSEAAARGPATKAGAGPEPYTWYVYINPRPGFNLTSSRKNNLRKRTYLVRLWRLFF